MTSVSEASQTIVGADLHMASVGVVTLVCCLGMYVKPWERKIVAEALGGDG